MKALIVDDDLALSDVVSFTMRRAGFDVITAYFIPAFFAIFAHSVGL